MLTSFAFNTLKLYRCGKENHLFRPDISTVMPFQCFMEMHTYPLHYIDEKFIVDVGYFLSTSV